VLTRRQTQLIRQLRQRHGRRKLPYCLGEGLRCCRELLALRPELVELAVCAESFPLACELPDLAAIALPDHEFAALSQLPSPQGILLVLHRPEQPPSSDLPPHPWVPVLDRLADPGNLGTILRTVRAVGVTEVWVTAGTVDPYGDKAIRTGLGAQFALAIREHPDLAAAAAELRRRNGGGVFRTDPHGGALWHEAAALFTHSAIIFGSEAGGAGKLDEAMAVTIPMPGGGESLNVAQAVTILCGEFLRRGSAMAAG